MSISNALDVVFSMMILEHMVPVSARHSSDAEKSGHLSKVLELVGLILKSFPVSMFWYKNRHPASRKLHSTMSAINNNNNNSSSASTDAFSSTVNPATPNPFVDFLVYCQQPPMASLLGLLNTPELIRAYGGFVNHVVTQEAQLRQYVFIVFMPLSPF